MEGVFALSSLASLFNVAEDGVIYIKLVGVD